MISSNKKPKQIPSELLDEPTTHLDMIEAGALVTRPIFRRFTKIYRRIKDALTERFK